MSFYPFWKDVLFSPMSLQRTVCPHLLNVTDVSLYPSPSDSEVPDRLRELLEDRGFSSQMKSRCCHENPLRNSRSLFAAHLHHFIDARCMIITVKHFYFFFCFPLECEPGFIFAGHRNLSFYQGCVDFCFFLHQLQNRTTEYRMLES